MSMSKIKHFFCLERSRTIFSHETIIKCSLSLHHKLIIYYCIVSRQLTNDKLGSCNNKKEKEYKTVKNSRDHWLHICLPESINPWLIVFKGRAHKRSAYIYIYMLNIFHAQYDSVWLLGNNVFFYAWGNYWPVEGKESKILRVT